MEVPTVKSNSVYQKKKPRMYDGRKSVLHVPDSGCNFYKTRKTGRLGSTENYIVDKKSCKLDSKICIDSSRCPFYKRKKPTKK